VLERSFFIPCTLIENLKGQEFSTVAEGTTVVVETVKDSKSW
jgi:hypothetical protein